MNDLLGDNWLIKDSTVRFYRKRHRDYIPSVVEDCCYEQLKKVLRSVRTATPTEIEQIYKKFDI